MSEAIGLALLNSTSYCPLKIVYHMHPHRTLKERMREWSHCTTQRALSGAGDGRQKLSWGPGRLHTHTSSDGTSHHSSLARRTPEHSHVSCSPAASTVALWVGLVIPTAQIRKQNFTRCMWCAKAIQLGCGKAGIEPSLVWGESLLLFSLPDSVMESFLIKLKGTKGLKSLPFPKL